MITRSGLVDVCDADFAQIPMTDSTLGLRALMRFFGNPFVGKFASWSTACTWCPAPMANRVSVAVGESETMQWGVKTLAAPSDALSSGNASALTKSATTNRSGLNMDISFPSKLVWTTDGYPNDRSLPSRAVFHISSPQATWLMGFSRRPLT